MGSPRGTRCGSCFRNATRNNIMRTKCLISSHYTFSNRPHPEWRKFWCKFGGRCFQGFRENHNPRNGQSTVLRATTGYGKTQDTCVCVRQSCIDVLSVLLTEIMLVDVDIRGEVRGQLQFPGDLYLEVRACLVFCPIWQEKKGNNSSIESLLWQGRSYLAADAELMLIQLISSRQTLPRGCPT